MAEIVYGFGTSHGPLLNLPPEEWEVRANFDRAQTELAFREGTYSFDELRELRKGDNFEAQNKIEVRTERYQRCQKQLDALSDKIAEVDPDLMVIVGDDQHEWFMSDTQPCFAVFCGDQSLNLTYSPEEKEERIRIGRTGDMYAYRPEQDQSYPNVPELAARIMEQAMDDEFDVAACMEQPCGPGGMRSIGHAFGFIYRRIMLNKPVPLVPILINTFYPPNQPTPKRCYEFGKSIGRAIGSWESGKRIAVAASGGLSHFVVDEKWDDWFVTAILNDDTEALTGEPNIMFRSGTSETKNWITVAGILSETNLKMDLLDYVPCYRSEAGTGSGMGFATWT